MAKYRLILGVKGDLEDEMVLFTDDYDTPGEDFLLPGWEISFDGVIEADLPDVFPLSSELVRM